MELTLARHLVVDGPYLHVDRHRHQGEKSKLALLPEYSSKHFASKQQVDQTLFLRREVIHAIYAMYVCPAQRPYPITNLMMPQLRTR